LGPTISSIKRDSISSSSSSTLLLGRMSGASLQRPDFVPSAAQQQQARQYMEQQLLQQQAQAQAQAAAAAAGVSLQLPPHMPAGGSAASSPPHSPKRPGRHGSARPSADGSGSYAGAGMQPVPPQALGLPAIATTMPVPIPGTSPPAGAGVLCAICKQLRSLSRVVTVWSAQLQWLEKAQITAMLVLWSAVWAAQLGARGVRAPCVVRGN
jgi:hypothetical protein